MDLDVNIIGVGSGFTYATDGPTHHGVQDLSAMINLPNLQVFNVTDDLNTKKLVEYSYNNGSPKYFRIEKGMVPRIYFEKDDINVGLKNITNESADVLVFSTGFITHSVLNVLKKLKDDGITASHSDIYRLSPLPKDKIVELAKDKRVITVEENLKSGGMGEKIFSLLKDNNHQKEVMNISIEDKFYFNFGDRHLLHKVSNIDESSLYERIKNFII
jgi:transketolase C-terminal domain/subunit